MRSPKGFPTVTVSVIDAGSLVKVNGEWKCLDRAVDSEGNTIDFMLSAKRDKKAASRFLKKVLKAKNNKQPRVTCAKSPTEESRFCIIVLTLSIARVTFNTLTLIKWIVFFFPFQKLSELLLMKSLFYRSCIPHLKNLRIRAIIRECNSRIGFSILEGIQIAQQ